MNKLKSLCALVAIATLAGCKKEEKIVIETHPDKTLGERMHDVGDTISYTAHRAGNKASDAYEATKEKARNAKDSVKNRIHNATK